MEVAAYHHDLRFEVMICKLTHPTGNRIPRLVSPFLDFAGHVTTVVHADALHAPIPNITEPPKLYRASAVTRCSLAVTRCSLAVSATLYQLDVFKGN